MSDQPPDWPTTASSNELRGMAAQAYPATSMRLLTGGAFSYVDLIAAAEARELTVAAEVAPGPIDTADAILRQHLGSLVATSVAIDIILALRRNGHLKDAAHV